MFLRYDAGHENKNLMSIVGDMEPRTASIYCLWAISNLVTQMSEFTEECPQNSLKSEGPVVDLQILYYSLNYILLGLNLTLWCWILNFAGHGFGNSFSQKKICYISQNKKYFSCINVYIYFYFRTWITKLIQSGNNKVDFFNISIKIWW